MFSNFSAAVLLWIGVSVFWGLHSAVRPVGDAALSSQTHSVSLLRTERTSAEDLAVSGEIVGIPRGDVRYVRYEDLLRLPQVSYTISDDENFKGSTEISGVPLSDLAALFGQDAHSNLIIAICYDKYRANYPNEYVSAHRPILVLKIDGKLRDKWPLSEYGSPLGPYLISHPPFKPSFKILSHEDQPQVPFGVVRLEFRKQAEVYAPIEPKGITDKGNAVWQGYQIARQDCFRCHGLSGEGGEQASRSWLILGAWASTDPEHFQQYVHSPQSVMKCAKMPAHSNYDTATLEALTRYFRTFVVSRPGE